MNGVGNLAKMKTPPTITCAWPSASLGTVCEINPRRPDIVRADSEMTTFIPMAAVAEAGRGILKAEVRPHAQIRRGYTYFAEGDVLFAKITPCMQNGKHAIARGLLGGFGFGTTEFHVIRPGPALTPGWVLHFLLQPSILRAAEAHFSGAVGQQRVPESFLAGLSIPMAPLPEQERIITVLNKQSVAVDRALAAIDVQLRAANALVASTLRQAFTSSDARKWPARTLGDVLRLRKEVVHPRDNPMGAARFVGLEHIESGTGRRLGELVIELSALTGRKPRFYARDIVYGYLRPYLNKVWVAEFDGLCSVDQYVYSTTEKVDATFIAWFMRSPIFLDRAPISTTPGQLPRIRTDEVAGVAINLPPIREQRRIAAALAERMAQTQRLKSDLKLQAEAISALASAQLRRAFSGGFDGQ